MPGTFLKNNDYRETGYSPGELRGVLVHESLHSSALSADKHGDVVENPEEYYDLKEIDMLQIAIQEGDPTYQYGELVLLNYNIFYGAISALYNSRNSAFQEYYEDPWSPENPDSWNDPQRVYNSVASGKKDESALREEIIKSAERSVLFKVLKISQADRERLLKQWFSSENWENFLEDYEYHYQFILDEITNEFEDYEIMTLEERVQREEGAARAREARERQVVDLDGYRSRKLR